MFVRLIHFQRRNLESVEDSTKQPTEQIKEDPPSLFSTKHSFVTLESLVWSLNLPAYIFPKETAINQSTVSSNNWCKKKSFICFFPSASKFKEIHSSKAKKPAVENALAYICVGVSFQVQSRR